MTYEQIQNMLDLVRQKTGFVPEVALVLGSGLGGFADKIEKESEIPYSEITGFPLSTVPGHEGKFIFGSVGGVRVAAMQGRVHYYEGYDMDEVVLPIRILRLMGAEKLILTNAAGGINPSFESGDFMIIKDHIASFVPSVLRGANIDELGVRFPDMSSIYDPELISDIKKSAAKVGINIKEGVYLQTPGPNYESCAEIQMYKILGADAVGMSTACEAIAANHMGMKICGISCISNLAAGIAKHPLTHAEVKETADRVSVQFEELIYNLIKLQKTD